MIAYFTGTGNSRFIAKRLGELLDDEVYDIADDLRTGRVGLFRADGPLVFVTPAYMSRMPPVVESYIRRSDFHGCSGDAYFVFSAAEAMGKAARRCERLCAEKGLTYQGTTAIKSPANYVVMYDVTPKEQARQEMEKALPAIRDVARAISAGARISVGREFDKHRSFTALAPTIMHVANARGFHASDACVGCGTCERVCPLGNVVLRDGRPAWGGNCTHCMACISACPTRAIDYGKKTQDRNRYYLA